MTTGFESGIATANIAPVAVTPIDQMPLIERPRIVAEGITVNAEAHQHGREMLVAMHLDPNVGDLIIGDPTPGSKCIGGSIAEALATGHGGLQATFQEALQEAETEGVNPDTAIFRSVRAYIQRIRDPETGTEQLLTVGPHPKDNSQNPEAMAALKKNNG